MRIAICAKGRWPCTSNYGFGLWHTARKSDGVAVGMCGLLKRDILPDVDIGYAFLPGLLGQGFAFEAADADAAPRRREIRPRTRHRRGVARATRASIRVLEKLGMSFERMYPMHPDEPAVRLYGRAFDGDS